MKDLKVKIANRIDLWSEYVRTIKGMPFSLDERIYLRQIYNEFGPGVTHKVLILKCGRKVEKTETIMNLLLYPLYNYEHFVAVYCTPRLEQISRFVNERVMEAIKTSVDRCLVPRYDGGGTTQKKFHVKEGTRNYLYSYSAWADAVALLGIAGDCVFADEVQEMPLGFFPMLNEIVTQSDLKWVVLSGTARETGSEFSRFWEGSTKNEWVVECLECGHKQKLGLETIMGKKDHKYKGCIKCKEELDTLHGEWVEENGGARFIGYHLNQVIHRKITANEIWDKWTNPHYSERKFYNEVLGEFYSGDVVPITLGVIFGGGEFPGIVDENLAIVDKLSPPAVSYLGIDWGTSTRAVIITHNKDQPPPEGLEEVELEKWKKALKKKPDKFTILNVLKWDSRRKDDGTVVTELMEQYNVKQVVADFGYGASQLKKLQEVFGDRVKSCYYTKSPLTPIDYKRRDKDRNLLFMIKADKTTLMEEIIEHMKAGRIRIPYGPKLTTLEWVFDEFTAIRSSLTGGTDDESEKPSYATAQTKYGRATEDHSFHALAYAILATRPLRQPIIVKTFDL